MTKSKTAIIAWAVTAAALVSIRATAGPATPEEVIRTTSVQVIEVLADKSKTTEQKKTILDGYLDTCCDFVTISKLVMAKNWKTLKEPQQGEFIGLFRKYLVATYGDAIENYSGETVQVLSGRKEARDDYKQISSSTTGCARPRAASGRSSTSSPRASAWSPTCVRNSRKSSPATGPMAYSRSCARRRNPAAAVRSRIPAPVRSTPARDSSIDESFLGAGGGFEPPTCGL
jgi:hypothetical protein